MSSFPSPQFIESVDSTNLHLKNQLGAGQHKDLAIWAKKQTAGRGRLGRQWLSPEGGLYISVCTTISDCPPTWFGFAMGLAAQKVFASRVESVSIKWPNDLLAQRPSDDRECKLGGILAELITGVAPEPFVVVGLGVNINTPIELPAPSEAITPTNLKELTNQEHHLQALAEQLVSQAFTEFEVIKQSILPLELRQNQLQQKWERASSTIGQWVRVQVQGKQLKGKVLGLTTDFALKVETEKGRVEIVQAGDCYHLRAEEMGNQS